MKHTVEHKLANRYGWRLAHKLIFTDLSTMELVIIADGGKKTNWLQNFFGGVIVFVIAALVFIGMYVNQV